MLFRSHKHVTTAEYKLFTASAKGLQSKTGHPTQRAGRGLLGDDLSPAVIWGKGSWERNLPWRTYMNGTA